MIDWTDPMAVERFNNAPLWGVVFCSVFDWRLACGDGWDSAFWQAAMVADFEVEHG